MPGKHSDCCCCPNCTYRVELCCPCVCPAICVTFTPDDYADCDPVSTEFDWNDAINGYSGSLHGHDLYYYIERDPPAEGQERGPCKFKLRSTSLGYPEGYEYEWEIPCDPYDEIPCTTCLALETELGVPAEEYEECSGGTLSTYCVEWITPTKCRNCFCLCECICVFVTKDGIEYSGKACWSEYEQAYEGDVHGSDAYGQAVSLGVSVPIARWGDVCDPDTDYDCDPYSDDCAIRLEIIDGEDRFESAWQKMAEPCQLRAVTYSFHIERDPYNDADDIEASVRCATCNEDCEPSILSCCENISWPTTLNFSLESVDGEQNADACLIWGEESTTLTHDGTNWMGQIIHDLFWTEQYEMVFDISISGSSQVGNCNFSLSWYMRDVATQERVGDIGGWTLLEGSDLIVYESCDSLSDAIADARQRFIDTGAPVAVMCCDPPFLFGKFSEAGEIEPCVYEFTMTA